MPPLEEGQYGTEVKLHDKVKALELLGKHLGVFDSGNGPGSEQENNIFEVIDQSTREEIDTDDIPEIEPPAKSGHDLVEWPGFEDYDGIICDGSIRSGKTVAMTVGFVMWAMRRFQGQNFALCGKTIESLRRNVTSNLPNWLAGVFSFSGIPHGKQDCGDCRRAEQ